ASILGTLVAFVAARFRHSNLVSIVVYMFALIAFIGLSFTTGDSGEEMVNMSRALTDNVNSVYPLAELYTKAVCDVDFIALAGFLLISLTAFFVYSYIIGKVFKKINSAVMTGRYRANYKLGELKTSTPVKALFLKEIKRYFSSTGYVLNTGF